MYSDGSCVQKTMSGSYAVILFDAGVRYEFCKCFSGTTNNRMELMGIIEIMELFDERRRVLITTDSKYVTDSIHKKWLIGWAKRNFTNIANPDLWRRMWEIVNSHDIEFRWCKGHQNNRFNNECDKLAGETRRSKNFKEYKDIGCDVEYNRKITESKNISIRKYLNKKRN